MDVPLQDDSADVTHKYLAPLRMQVALRLVDFLTMSMLMPTLNQFMLSVGGTNVQYFLAYVVQSGVGMIGIFVAGMIADRTGDLFTPYVIGLFFLLAGNVVYVLADIVPVLRSPATIIFSRVLVGIGVSNATLGMMYLGRTCSPTDRMKWAGLMSLTRTMGLICGPALTVLLQIIFNSSKIEKPSLFDMYALPSTVLAIANVACIVGFFKCWVRPPALVKKDAADTSEEMSSFSFLCNLRSFAMIFTFMTAGFLMQCIEPLVPVIATEAMGWTGSAGTGLVFILIGVVVIISQIIVLSLRTRVSITNIWIIGPIGFAFLSVFSLALWLAAFGTEIPVSKAQADSGRFFVMFPLVILEGCMPFMAISSITIWTNIVQEEVPNKAGLMQAIFNGTNMLATIGAPIWSAISYSDNMIAKEGLPWTMMLGLAVLSGLLLLTAIAVYPQLQPAPAAEATAASASRHLGALPATVPKDEAVLYQAPPASPSPKVEPQEMAQAVPLRKRTRSFEVSTGKAA